MVMDLVILVDMVTMELVMPVLRVMPMPVRMDMITQVPTVSVAEVIPITAVMTVVMIVVMIVETTVIAVAVVIAIAVIPTAVLALVAIVALVVTRHRDQVVQLQELVVLAAAHLEAQEMAEEEQTAQSASPGRSIAKIFDSGLQLIKSITWRP